MSEKDVSSSSHKSPDGDVREKVMLLQCHVRQAQISLWITRAAENNRTVNKTAPSLFQAKSRRAKSKRNVQSSRLSSSPKIIFTEECLALTAVSPVTDLFASQMVKPLCKAVLSDHFIFNLNKV